MTDNEMNEAVDESDWMEPEEEKTLKKSKEDFELEVWLSTDGKHTVRVLAKD
jgi:hypothetical protein